MKPVPLNLQTMYNTYRLPPKSPFVELKSQLPVQLSHNPRQWDRDDVNVFIRFCEREYDLPPIDLGHFSMNGKALCTLTKLDLAERVPGAGDILHNVLQCLIEDTHNLSLGRGVPASPQGVPMNFNIYKFSPYNQPRKCHFY